MRLGCALRSRDTQAAAHSSRLILMVCAAVVSGLTIFQQSGSGTFVLAVHWMGVATLVAGAVACTVVSPDTLDRLGIGVLIAVVGVLLISTLNLLTSDTSAAAQAFLAFPVLWAASHLRRAGVALVTAVALLGDGLTLFFLLPASAALTDFVFFGSVLVVMAVMLTRATGVQQRLVVALQEQARIDALTGLVNRRAFDDALASTLTRPVRAGTALVLIDVDSFKTINDAHGHPVGDAALVHLAELLRQQVRAEDAVLSRLGGDELAVLLPDCAADVAARRADELLSAVRAAPLPLAGGSLLALSISVGVAHVLERSGDLQTLYHAADTALYDAKRSGRGRVAVAVP